MTKEELEKEAEEWLCNNLHSASEEDFIKAMVDIAEPREKRIADLEAQIEKMKCCGNCENGELSAHEEPCRHCQRCFVSKDVTDQENVKDNWEEIKEVKEK